MAVRERKKDNMMVEMKYGIMGFMMAQLEMYYLVTK